MAKMTKAEWLASKDANRILQAASDVLIRSEPGRHILCRVLVDVAEYSFKYTDGVTRAPTRHCIDTLHAWCRGQATKAEVAAAGDAAGDAAGAAAWAAGAAGDAAWAAGAAGDAWAAGAAGAAAWAAGAAAWAAGAAGDAAGAAAWDAAQADLADIVRRYLPILPSGAKHGERETPVKFGSSIACWHGNYILVSDEIILVNDRGALHKASPAALVTLDWLQEHGGINTLR